jgi:hypothetical protein
MGLTGTHFGGLPPNAKAEVAAEINSDQQELAQLQARRNTILKARGSTDKIDSRIRDLQSEIQGLQAARSGKIQPSSVNLSGSERLPAVLREALVKARDNPELVIYKLKTNAYKYGWALIPISAPFVWLLFPFSRRFKLYDHTVFVTYSLCFMLLLLTAGTLLGMVSMTLAGLAWFVPPFHMYRQLRGTYGVSRFGAIWRTFALTVFAFMAIGFFATLLVALGAMD